MKLILASASKARLQLLQNSGILPKVETADLDEETILEKNNSLNNSEKVNLLAKSKARIVFEKVKLEENTFSGLILACDSMFELNNNFFGKPKNKSEIISRLEKFSNNEGYLHTGHHLMHIENGFVLNEFNESDSSKIIFNTINDLEIEKYIQTNEPFSVAGPFTIDGFGSWFIKSIEGHPSNVIGLSFPVFKKFLAKLNIPIYSLWNV